MTKPIYACAVALILGLLLITQSGCLLIAAAAGTGATVAYVTGDLETTVDAGPKAVAEATERACKDLDLTVTSKKSSNIDGKITASSGRGVKLTVVIKGQSDHASHVSIRAGVFGNDSIHDRLMQKIRDHLASAPATQPIHMASTSQPTHSASTE